MTLQEKREKRAKLITDARALYDVAKKDKRDKLNAVEQASFNTMFADAATLKTEIESEERLLSLDEEHRQLQASTGRRSVAGQPGASGDPGGASDKPVEVEIRGLKRSFKPGTPEFNRSNPEQVEHFRNFLRTGEKRTANAFANDVFADGGALHAPVQYVASLLKTLGNLVFVRSRARILPVTTGDAIATPVLATKLGAAAWIDELAAIVPDVTPQFAQRLLTPHLCAKACLISQKLLQTAAISPEQIVEDELSRVFGEAEESAYMTGDGVKKPLGVFTASPSGIDTSRDVVVSATSGAPTVVTFDGLMAQKFGLKAQYRNGASWTLNRLVLASIAGIKDGQGRYIWQPSTQMNVPDMLLGYPVDESEYAPGTMTAGMYVSLFGNWNWYWIAELETGYELQRLTETYAMTSQVCIVGRRYLDGQPVQAEAFTRGKLAAS